MSKTARIWGLCCASLLVPFIARAEGPVISFGFEGCGDAMPPSAERLARLELRAESGSLGAVTHIAVRCAAGEVELTVDDPMTGKKVDRSVSLAGVPEGSRPRLLALAIAELVRSSWIELEINPVPALPIVAPVVVPVAQKEAARRVAAASLETRQQARTPWSGSATFHAMLTSSLDLLLGGQLGLRRRILGPWFAEADASFFGGAVRRTPGSVDVTHLVLDLAAGLGNALIDVKLGARFGGAWLSGSPNGGAIHGLASGFVWGPMVSSTLRLIGPARLWAEVGWLVRGVKGQVSGDSDVAVSQAWASLGLGVTF